MNTLSLRTLMGRILLSLLSVVGLVLCAPAKTVTADEMRSHLLSALSLTSETELFIGQIESARVPSQFQVGHAEYLRDEAERDAKELPRLLDLISTDHS